VILAPLLRAAATPLFSNHFPIYSLTPFRADTLALGAFIAVAERESGEWIRSMRRSAVWGSVGSGILLLAFSLFPSFRTGANSVFFNAGGYSLSVTMFGGALIYVLGAGEGVVSSLLTLRPLRYLGRISYTFYLYHVAVLGIVAHYLNSLMLKAIASLILTIAIAALSWHVLESPILKRRRRAVEPLGSAVAA
jgi:peptidoglycan/LPS O-acetylase OafA/YrhL